MTVRRFERSDIERVVEMHLRVVGPPERPDCPDDLDYELLFFSGPWVREDFPSYVYDGADARVLGFIGVVPHRFRLAGQPITIAVPTRFIVDSEQAGPVSAGQLVHTMLRGPQDATVVDRSNEAARRMLVSAGAVPVHFRSLRWVRVLRGGAYALRRLARTTRTRRTIVRAAQWPIRLVDIMLRLPLPSEPGAGETRTHLPDVSAIAPFVLDEMHHFELHPDRDVAQLTRVFAERARIWSHLGPLCATVVRDARDRPMGWYVRHRTVGGISEVVALAARRFRENDVLCHLIHEAWEDGAVAVSGRADPRFAPALAHTGCFYRGGDSWMLVHDRGGRVRRVLEGETAYWSEVEGEWW